MCSSKSTERYIYDRKVVKQKFRNGQWVWYFYPKNYKGRSPTWAKTYVCPLLIVAVVSVTNVRVQKTRNRPSQVVHVDNLKMCRGETPKSWLAVDEDDDDTVDASGDEAVVEAILDDNTVERQPDEANELSTDLQPADAEMNVDQQCSTESIRGTAEDKSTEEADATSSERSDNIDHRLT